MREIVSSYKGRALAPIVTAADILARPAYIGGGWLSARLNWSEQERAKLAILCEASAPIEKSADALGRPPRSLAWQARDLGLPLPSTWSALIKPARSHQLRKRREKLCYPYIISSRPSDGDLLQVNELVPRHFPEWMRADICQNIMLALYEGDTSLAELKANRSNLRWFVKRYYREQTPYQEIKLSDYDDNRSYDEIAASVKTSGIAAALNEARLSVEALALAVPPMQIDYVYEQEISEVRRAVADGHYSREEVRAMLRDGTLKIRDARMGSMPR